LAARLTGTLAEVEALVRAVEQVYDQVDPSKSFHIDRTRRRH
jgi:hypothetical protein